MLALLELIDGDNISPLFCSVSSTCCIIRNVIRKKDGLKLNVYERDRERDRERESGSSFWSTLIKSLLEHKIK